MKRPRDVTRGASLRSFETAAPTTDDGTISNFATTALRRMYRDQQ